MRPTMKGFLVNPAVAKFAVKGVLGLAVSAVIGVLIKLEHHADERIDEHYNSKKKTEENTD